MSTAPEIITLRAAHLLTMDAAPAAALPADASVEERRARDAELTGALEDGAVLVEEGVVTWVGPWRRRPKRSKREGALVLETGVLMPSWIDAATRPVFAATSHADMLLGARTVAVSDEQHRAAVLRTVEATREADTERLQTRVARVSFDATRQGAGLVAARTGYGLSMRRELGHLQLLDRVAREMPCALRPVLTPGLVIPPERSREEHVGLMCDQLIARAHDQGLTRHLEAPCMPTGWTLPEARRLVAAARGCGWHVRVLGDARMALELDASALHLLHPVMPSQHSALAERAVLVTPTLHLLTQRQRPAPDLRALADAGIELALASGLDAETTTTQDLSLALRGALALGLTPGEGLRALTRGAAQVMGEHDTWGVIAPGRPANLSMFAVDDPDLLVQHINTSHVDAVMVDGQFIYWTEAADV